VHLWSRKDRKSLAYVFKVGMELRKERYDVVFNLTNTFRNYLLTFLMSPKKTVARKNLNRLWVEEFFYTAKSVFPDIELPDILCLGVIPEADGKIENFVKEYPQPYTVIVAGGGTDAHRQGRIWSADNWKKLTELVLKKYGGTVFVCGSKKEREYHKQFEGENIVVTSGDFNLSESSALLSKADIVISGDTGPVHIASAHNVPVISLIGSTSPDKIKPYGKNGHYVSAKEGCRYCWKKKCKFLKQDERYTPCMENITPDMVMDKIEQESILKKYSR
jgi:ADP-heptose:LPS heptosyltransferase